MIVERGIFDESKVKRESGRFALKSGPTVHPTAKSKGKSGKGGKGKGKGGASKPADGNLSFDGKRGAGYGTPGGDARVKSLQGALNRLGLTDSAGAELKADGKMGPKTTAAVKKAQRALGLKADGVVTPALLAQLVKAKKLGKAAPAPAKKAAPAKARTGAGRKPVAKVGARTKPKAAQAPVGSSRRAAYEKNARS